MIESGNNGSLYKFGKRRYLTLVKTPEISSLAQNSSPANNQIQGRGGSWEASLVDNGTHFAKLGVDLNTKIRDSVFTGLQSADPTVTILIRSVFSPH